MSNDSATGGYLVPSSETPIPGGLTFLQFLQTMFVGISGLDPTLVRPKWQKSPPKQPDTDTDWMAIGLGPIKGDANAYIDILPDGSNTTQRHEEIEIQCSFYGPNSYEFSTLVRDGLYMFQNLEALTLASMGLKEATNSMHIPDLVNEVWVDRWEMSVFIRRERLRVYPILSFLTLSGSIKSVVGGTLKTIAVNVNQ